MSYFKRKRELSPKDDSEGDENSSEDDSEGDENSSEGDENSSEEENDSEVKYESPKNQNKFKKTTFTLSGIYVLENLSGKTPKFYVGKSNNITHRIHAHKTVQGGVGYLTNCNLRQVPLISHGSLDDLESWERNETIERMYRYGIDNVRGWMFTSLSLSEEQYQAAFNQICEKFDLCRRCGHNSHFKQKCFARTTAAWSGKMSLFD